MNSVPRLLLAIALLDVGFSSVPLADEPVRTGSFSVRFSPQTLLGTQGAIDAKPILRSEDDLRWQIYVPSNYDPARPAGVMVYVSPTQRGGPPNRWKTLFDEKNVIWIGAKNAGNRTGVGKCMFLAMLAPRMLARDYNLDEARIYVAGFSGGGKTASRLAIASPDLFRGGIYIGGAETWASNSPPTKLENLRRNRHVFLTGTNDFNERLTRHAYTFFRGAGIRNCELIVVSRMGHELPNRSVFGRAIDYLDASDSRLHKAMEGDSLYYASEQMERVVMVRQLTIIKESPGR